MVFHKHILFNPLVHKYSFGRINNTAFENIAGKLYPICPYFDIIFLFAAELEDPNIGIWGRGLIKHFCRRECHKCPFHL